MLAYLMNILNVYISKNRIISEIVNNVMKLSNNDQFFNKSWDLNSFY